MDPTLFRIDWDVLAELLITIIVLSFLIERALALLFEHRLYVKHFHESGFKEPIAFLVSLTVVWIWQFDALSIMLKHESMTVLGFIITAGIIAGGSKASIKLFHDVMDTKSAALRKKTG